MGAGCPDPVVHRPDLPRALLCKRGSCPGTALVAACKLRGLHEGSGGARGRLSRGRWRAPLTATLEQPPLRLRSPRSPLCAGTAWPREMRESDLESGRFAASHRKLVQRRAGVGT